MIENFEVTRPHEADISLFIHGDVPTDAPDCKMLSYDLLDDLEEIPAPDVREDTCGRFSQAFSFRSSGEGYVEEILGMCPWCESYATERKDDETMVFFDASGCGVNEFVSDVIVPMCEFVDRNGTNFEIVIFNEDRTGEERFKIERKTVEMMLWMKHHGIYKGEELFPLYRFLLNMLRPEIVCPIYPYSVTQMTPESVQYNLLFNVIHNDKWKEMYRNFRKNGHRRICDVSVSVNCVGELPEDAPDGDYIIEDVEWVVCVEFVSNSLIDMTIKLQVAMMLSQMCYFVNDCNFEKFVPCCREIFIRTSHYVPSWILNEMDVMLKNYPEILDIIRKFRKDSLWKMTSLTKRNLNKFIRMLNAVGETDINFKLV